MIELKVIDFSGSVTSQMKIDESLLIKDLHKQAIFESIIAENASKRQGTHSTLTKGEVRGGGKKPYAQKHTGNARQGSIRNPHYVGGGVVFGPKPTRNYLLKVNKKVSRLAFLSTLHNKILNNAIQVLDKVEIKKPSSKKVKEMLKALKLNGKKVLLILGEKDDQNIFKSARNIHRVVVKTVKQVSTKDLIHADCVLIQRLALATLIEVKE